MKHVIADFFQLGALRVIAKGIMALRGLLIVSSLSPGGLGEYTIWLLFVFYFEMLDLGVRNALERDLPHYRGKNDLSALVQTRNVGWTTFFILAGLASLLLTLVTFLVFQQLLLSVLLGLYLFTDKVYRAYYAGSRLNLRYRENGVAELVLGLTSLLVIWLLLPRYGPYMILWAVICASLVASLFLFRMCPLEMKWQFSFRSSVKYIRSAISLAGLVYSIELFHAIAMTILAFQLDKTSLGYFAFAYKVFYVSLAIFPFLIQEVMRTRMYYKVAQLKQTEEGGLTQLFGPMVLYSVITMVFWLGLYWWADWGIQRFVPAYSGSVMTLKLLTLALLPLGIVKICSDYLCSLAQRRTIFVVKAWGGGIALQALSIFILFLNGRNVLPWVPFIYLSATLLVYALIVGAALNVRQDFPRGIARMIYLTSPLLAVMIVIYFASYRFGIWPVLSLSANLGPFLCTAGISGVISTVIINLIHQNKSGKLSILA